MLNYYFPCVSKQADAHFNTYSIWRYSFIVIIISSPALSFHP